MKRLGISGKLIVIAIGAILIARFISTYFVLRNFTSAYKESVFERVFAQADQLKIMIEDLTSLGLQIGELKGLSQECRKIVESLPYAQCCAVLGISGEIFYQSHSALDNGHVCPVEVAKKVFDSSQPLVQENVIFGDKRMYIFSVPIKDMMGEPVGFIRIGILSDIISKKVLLLRNFSIFLGLLFSFLVSIIVYMLSKIIIIKPIKMLMEGAKNIGAGDLDSKINLSRGDEVGDLADAFNKMAKNLKGVTASRDELNREIAQKEVAEQALRREKDLAQQYLDVAGVMMVAVDEHGCVLLVNERGCEVLGYHKDEIIGKNWFNLFLPQKIADRLNKVHLRLMAGEIELFRYYENSILTKKKEERIIFWNNSLLHGEKGEVIGVLSSGEDITERRKAEQAIIIQRDLATKLLSVITLKDAYQEFLNTFLKFEGFDCGIVYAVNKKGVLELFFSKGVTDEYTNKVSFIVEGSSEDQHIKINRPLYVFDDEVSTFFENERRKEGLKSFAVIPIFEGKQLRAVFYIASHFYKNIPLQLRNVVETISSTAGGVVMRLATEEKLRESDMIINKSPAVAFSWKNESQWPVEFASENVKQIFGYSAEEFISGEMLFSKCIHPDDLDRVAQEVDAASKQKEIKEFKHNPYRIVTKEGEIKWIDDWTFVVRDEEDNAIQFKGIIEDITQRKKDEQWLRIMYKDLEKAHARLKEIQSQLLQSEKMAAIGQLSAGFAHEVKNPLAIIMLTVDALEKNMSKLSEKDKKHLQSINNAAERANKVVVELLKFSRYSRTDLKKVSIHEALDNIISISDIAFKEKNIVFQKEFVNKKVFINADKVLIEQVFFNLFTNAADAIGEEGIIVVKTSILEKTEEHKKEIIVEVSDTGSGMPKETASKIFEPFYTTKDPDRGTGLGLSTAFMILERHGGSISVESNPGKGTKFFVKIPVIS